MYFNYLPRVQCNCLQYLVQRRQLRLLRRHVNIGAKPPIIRGRFDVVPILSQQQTKMTNYRMLRPYSTHGDIVRQQQVFNEVDELDNKAVVNSNGTSSLQLSTGQSVQELLTSMGQDSLNGTQQVQGILKLWMHYQRMALEDKLTLSDQLQTQVMPQLETHISEMDIEELSCCFLYLRKMHVPNSDCTLERILTRALKIIELEVGKELIPLPALSRLLVAVNLKRDFFTPLVCRNFTPHLERHIVDCHTEQQVRLLSTCLFQLHTLIDNELLEAFKQRVGNLLQAGTLSSSTPKALLKLLHMLNLPVWSNRNTALIRQLMLELRDCLPQLESSDLKSVCRTFLHHQEPASLIQPLKEATEALMQREPSADALSCAVPFSNLQQRDAYIRQFQELLKSKDAWELPNASGHFFSVLRALKIADVRYCNAYWTAVMDELETDQTHLRFLRHCQRYMNFNNNLGGTYRHHDVERKLSRMCLDAIENSVAGRLPSKFAHLAAFVMAYGLRPLPLRSSPIFC